ncbi:MAG: hypothetical protein M3077_05980 [Candidatus Dormibacteraeota bacterium]|nr:hypothetical protein [Candidatus Dormibacteraeota bacterium]
MNLTDRVPRFRYLPVTLLLALAACAGPSSPSPSATASTATISGSATPSPTASAGYRVLFTAASTTSNDIFLYDSASNAPQRLVSLAAGPAPEPRFISAQKIAYIDSTNQGSSRIVTFDLSSRATATEISAPGYIPAFAYSHDGSRLAYLEHDPTAGKATLHVRTGGQDAQLSLNAVVGRGVSRDDELRLEYAPDDHFLLMVDTYLGKQATSPETGQFLVLRTGDNTVAFVPPSGISTNATMAVWARGSDRLYYRDQSGVRSWDAAATSVGTLVAGLRWYDPAVSPDGRVITFTDLDARSAPHVRLYDLTGHQVTPTSTQLRSHPIVVARDTIWYLEEQACTGECMAGPTTTTGRAFAYNVKTNSETALPFRDVNMLSELAVFSR